MFWFTDTSDRNYLKLECHCDGLPPRLIKTMLPSGLYEPITGSLLKSFHLEMKQNPTRVRVTLRRSKILEQEEAASRIVTLQLRS